MKNTRVLYMPGKRVLPLQHPIFDLFKSIERSYQRHKSEKDPDMLPSLLGTIRDRLDGFVPLACGPVLMRTAIVAIVKEMEDHPVALFSQADSESILLEMLGRETGISAGVLRDGLLKMDDWPSLAAAATRLVELPIFIENSRDITELRQKAGELVEGFHVEALFIDDLTFFYGKTGPGDDEVADSLARLSEELGVPVFGGVITGG